MSAKQDALHGTYRCPVCGHRDGVDVVAGAPAARVACSYCGSLLDVSARDRDAVNVNAQVAEVPVAG